MEVTNANQQREADFSFIGFRCDPAVKDRVRREAERRGTSMTSVLVELIQAELRPERRTRRAA